MNLSRKLSLLAVAASALALAACADAGMTTGAGSASTASAPASEAAMPTDMRGFVATAASSGIFEIQSSQLAKSRDVGAGTLAFADQLIREHTATSAAMTSMLAGMSPPMTPPATMTAKHQAMLETLQSAGNGDAFARAYASAQVMAHQEAVALYGGYAQRGDNAQLKQFAQTTLPSLKDHLAHAQRLNAGDLS